MVSQIVDAQVHLWTEVIPDPHIPQEPRFDTDVLLPLMDDAGVGRAILIPATWGADWNTGCLAAAARYPDRFAVMGRIEIDNPASRELLPVWRDQSGMLGLRVSLRREPWATWLVDGTADWLWTAAEDAGVPVMIYLPGRLSQVAKIAREHPGLKVVVDHMGILPTAGAEERALQLADLVALAPLDNVAVKVSALPLYSGQEFPFRDVHGLARTVVETFGPRRSFWGSDLTRLGCTYVEAVSMMDEVLEGLSASDRELVMGAAITDWLSWNLPT